MNVALFSGGVGGGRFAVGVADAVGAERLTVIGNVGDDVEILGMHVSPDLDSVLYALAGLHDEVRGWGRADETWNALETAAQIGGESWFKLGDRDIGLHLVRTRALLGGEPLSAVTARIAAALGVGSRILPATDDRLRTFLATDEGELAFQEWFVGRRHRDEVRALRYEGAETAVAAPGVLGAIEAADVLVIAPSNPYISVLPILAVREIREAVERRRVPCVAVSPLVGGKAIKGPAGAMLASLAGGTEPRHVAECYPGLVDALVLDEADAAGAAAVEELGVRAVVTSTLMSDPARRRALAAVVLAAV